MKGLKKEFERMGGRKYMCERERRGDMKGIITC
jgi:hypothetical protein